jgi:hypothetical protein
MRIVILLHFAFCLKEACVTPWAGLQAVMENTVQGTIADIKVAKPAANIDDHVVGEIVFGLKLISTEEYKLSQQRQSLSKFELAIVRCCSSTSDGYLDRCFALNGFGAIGFSSRPCRFLNLVLEKLNQKRK